MQKYIFYTRKPSFFAFFLEVLIFMSNFEAQIFINSTDMEETKRNNTDVDKEIVFSKSIKAGKRIYYVDVKKNRKNEMFLAITESKKVVSEYSGMPQVNFEKHKIFLYREDFEKFQDGLNEAINFINNEQGVSTPRSEFQEKEDVGFDIDFEV